MPQHQQVTESPYTSRQLFEMVVDVDKYSQFLPWCVASRVLERDGNVFTAELVVRFKTFRAKYTSEVTIVPPKGDHGKASVDVKLVEGPFEYLTNNWRFEPNQEGGTTIHLDMEFKFSSKILEKAIGGLFDRASIKMADAFEQRANELYAG